MIKQETMAEMTARWKQEDDAWEAECKANREKWAQENAEQRARTDAAFARLDAIVEQSRIEADWAKHRVLMVNEWSAAVQTLLNLDASMSVELYSIAARDFKQMQDDGLNAIDAYVRSTNQLREFIQVIERRMMADREETMRERRRQELQASIAENERKLQANYLRELEVWTPTGQAH